MKSLDIFKVLLLLGRLCLSVSAAGWDSGGSQSHLK